MILSDDPTALLDTFRALEPIRRAVDGEVAGMSEVTFYCVVCETFGAGSVAQAAVAGWVDLRSEGICRGCGHTSRSRLLIDVILRFAPNSSDALLFERVTALYRELSRLLPNVLGVEYGGSDLPPGSTFQAHGMTVQHEDMQCLSFGDRKFDLVIHSDVLEHVPNPFTGMAEVYRVLRPGGKCIFACPIYTQIEHRHVGFIGPDGNLGFFDVPVFHGDPLRENGVPVFYEFGLRLIDDLQRLGFIVSAIVDHSILKGYYSNNNPYEAGLMWPIVMVCEKPKL